ncbi:hypothetical protein C451_00645 [Halococcus thailandensis JCM 13552]|uniref:Uncharacterized protein n=1 Tax=Halococcus thailandensis JCM 13552 TaxID=1227457 RepID=M0NGS7_9EURY|nr:hypothetical protein C451_00645 [Halococcus thailandensis JCM 13552]
MKRHHIWIDRNAHHELLLVRTVFAGVAVVAERARSALEVTGCKIVEHRVFGGVVQLVNTRPEFLVDALDAVLVNVIEAVVQRISSEPFVRKIKQSRESSKRIPIGGGVDTAGLKTMRNDLDKEEFAQGRAAALGLKLVLKDSVYSELLGGSVESGDRTIVNGLFRYDFFKWVLRLVVCVRVEVVVVFDEVLIEIREEGGVDLCEIDLELSSLLRSDVVQSTKVEKLILPRDSIFPDGFDNVVVDVVTTFVRFDVGHFVYSSLCRKPLCYL